MAEPLLDALLDIIDAHNGKQLRGGTRVELEARLRRAIEVNLEDKIRAEAYDAQDSVWKVLERKFPEQFPGGWAVEEQE